MHQCSSNSIECGKKAKISTPAITYNNISWLPISFDDPPQET